MAKIDIPDGLVKRIEEYTGRRGKRGRQSSAYPFATFVREALAHYLDSPALKLLLAERDRIRELEKRVLARMERKPPADE